MTPRLDRTRSLGELTQRQCAGCQFGLWQVVVVASGLNRSPLPRAIILESSVSACHLELGNCGFSGLLGILPRYLISVETANNRP